MQIKQFRYSMDNLGYLIYGENHALAIDGGAVDEIISFTRDKNLTLKYITNTHSHPDHTSGTRELISRSGGSYLEIRDMAHKGSVSLENETIEVLKTPGHTADSITFALDGHLITGDTLFNGTVGNCFSGDLMAFFRSVKLLMNYPKETIVYAGHDYVHDSLLYAKRLEPNNGDIDLFLKGYNPEHVFSTIGDELKINPYLRFNEGPMISLLNEKGLPTGTEEERWLSVMKI